MFFVLSFFILLSSVLFFYIVFFFCISALRTVKEGACLISLIRRRRLFVVVRSPLGETLCQR